MARRRRWLAAMNIADCKGIFGDAPRFVDAPFWRVDVGVDSATYFGKLSNCCLRTISHFYWRRGRDSNPRYGFPYTHFPGVRLRPLGHPSTRCVDQREAGAIASAAPRAQAVLAARAARAHRQRQVGFRARARRERVRQVEKILKVSVRAVRPHLIGRARRHVAHGPAIRLQPTTAAMSLSPSPFSSARANAFAALSIMPAGAPSASASAVA